MKKRPGHIIRIAVVITLIMTLFVGTAFGATSLEDKSIYKAVGYKNRDCVLTSNVYMIRRAMIQMGSTKWQSVTNTTLRSTACTSPTGSSLKYTYTYTIDGISFTISHGFLTGSTANKKSQLRKLLKDHPEGVVIRGDYASISWGRAYPHGVLVTGYKDGVFYAADSTNNKDGVNVGIQKFLSTTMRGIGYCSDYWYISNISGKSSSAAKELAAIKEGVKNAEIYLDGTISGGTLTLNWKKSVTGYGVDGYRVLKASTIDGSYTLVAKTEKQYYKIDISNQTTGVCYQVMGYRVVDGKTVYTKSEFYVYVPDVKYDEEMDRLAERGEEKESLTSNKSEALVDPVENSFNESEEVI